MGTYSGSAQQQDITSLVTWSSSNTAVIATISGGSGAVLSTATSGSTTSVTASSQRHHQQRFDHHRAMTDIRCIGICTGGGDAPGLNAVIRAAVKCAFLKYNWKIIGIPDGFDGLIWPEKSYELTLKHVSGILPRGGTILGTTNRGNPFKYCTVENGQEVTRDISDEVIANARKLGIDAVISIGGDGSQTIALRAVPSRHEDRGRAQDD